MSNALDERERRILRLILQGKSRTEIAEALYVRDETAAVSIRQLREKFGVKTRSELIAAAKREGLSKTLRLPDTSYGLASTTPNTPIHMERSVCPSICPINR